MSDSQKIALITGCSAGGIGAALAQRLLSDGYRVFATARDTNRIDESLQQTCDLLALDVTSAESVKAAKEELASKTGGRLDLLVNNAGTGHQPCPMLDLDVDKAQKLYDANFFGVIRVCQAFAPLLIDTANSGNKQQSVILNIGSVTGVAAFPFRGLYSSSKAALHSINDALRVELAPFNVKVVVVVTGGVHTQIKGNAANVAQADPKDSPYAHIPELRQQLISIRASQDAKSISAQDYAAFVIPMITNGRAPSRIYAASYRFVFRWIVPLLPASLLDRIFGQKMGASLITYKPKGQ